MLALQLASRTAKHSDWLYGGDRPISARPFDIAQCTGRRLEDCHRLKLPLNFEISGETDTIPLGGNQV